MCTHACVQRGRAEASRQSRGPCLHAAVPALCNHAGKQTWEGKGDPFAAHQGLLLVDRGFQDSVLATGKGGAKERGGPPLGNISSPWETGSFQGQMHPGAEWGFLPHGTGSQLCFCSFAFKKKLQDFPQQPFLITGKKSISCP